ncbi:MAG TPA: undecaprenyl-diphosphate phosphatase [Myxococcota bacterium]|nr:undecaprenyl-diphosphate phosphatase [Myxococcota bacterium]
MALGLVVLLAVVQGVAEFLPISSSGHLRIIAELFGLDDPQTLFDVMLHVGTLVAVLVVYRERVAGLFGALGRLFDKSGRSWTTRWREDTDLRVLGFVIAATIPTGLIAISLGQVLEGWAASLVFVGAALLVNATLLVVLGRLIRSPRQARGLEAMTLRDALLIGLAQGFAVTRGISRSGSTITAGVLLGLRQDAAATFSFLLSVPAILGALVLTMKDFDGEVSALLPGVLGAVIAGVVGVVALKLLLRMLDRGRLGVFAIWCAAVGVFAIVWHFVSGYCGTCH